MPVVDIVSCVVYWTVIHIVIVIPHELDLLSKMDAHIEWNKSDIFNALWQESVVSSTSGLGTDDKKSYERDIHLLFPICIKVLMSHTLM